MGKQPDHAISPDVNHHALTLLRRRNRSLRRVNEVSQRLTSMLDEQEVMGYLLRASAEIIGAPAASLWMWTDEKRHFLECVATHPPENVEELRPLRLDAGKGVAGWVTIHRKSVVTDNAYADERFTSDIDELTGFNTQSMLAVPLILRGEAIGVIEILNKTRADFDDEDLAMVETLAAAASIALENAKLIASLREKTDELQAQNSELDAFAHTVAHDLKSPLATILGFSDFLQEINYDLDTEELAQVLKVINRSANKMNSIIQEILLLSGVRKKNVTIRPIHMAEIIRETKTRLRHPIRDSGVTLTFPEQWPSALGYAPWVEEIWVNYISNAIKYGGRPPIVELGYEESDGQVWFWVQDNGKGLSEEQMAQLFVPFIRLEEARAKGHGLGLSIVQRITKKFGGQVKVESKLGKGSRFYFSLPSTTPIPRY